MTPIQLYKLVEPDLALLDYFKTTSLCGPTLYRKYRNCHSCPYSKIEGLCVINFGNPNASKLKEMISIKHPEFFI